MEDQIADLTPDQRWRFEAALVAGASRYDALMEVMSPNPVRSRVSYEIVSDIRTRSAFGPTARDHSWDSRYIAWRTIFTGPPRRGSRTDEVCSSRRSHHSLSSAEDPSAGVRSPQGLVWLDHGLL